MNEDFLREFDFIWASPPCQAFTLGGRKAIKNYGHSYPDLIHETRKLLLKSEQFYVIENVCNAPIRKDLILCGVMFALGVIRHRGFELGHWWMLQPFHVPHKGTVPNGDYVTVASHGSDGSGKLDLWRSAMDIDWITNRKMLREAVPPAYSEYIGKAWLKQNRFRR